MSKRVLLTLMDGSFETGFPIVLRISEDDRATQEIQVIGKLPPAPQLLDSLHRWQTVYYQLVMPQARIQPKAAQITNVSCSELGMDFVEQFNRWLNSNTKAWRIIRDELQRSLNPTDEIQVILQTEDPAIRHLPWQSWDLFVNHYTQSEIVLSTSAYQAIRPLTIRTRKVRILAILGDSTGIDIQRDRALLEKLPNTDITFLVEPHREALNEQLWSQPWQIVFFAGHSRTESSGEFGRIYINRHDSLPIAELKHALRRAIAQGLQLAIFNSCDGLGLARELAELSLPQMIVMREPVPDQVAQAFLKQFLTSFVRGRPLHLAVREAREKLQGLEQQFPFASWLPIVCQNPTAKTLTWQTLVGRVVQPIGSRVVLPTLYRVLTVLLVSVISSWGILTIQNTAFRPSETPSPVAQPTAPPPSPLCYGESCRNKDAIATHCNYGVTDADSVWGSFKIEKNVLMGYRIQLRYSSVCHTVWARAEGPFFLDRYLAFYYLEDRQGKRYNQEKFIQAIERYGDMQPATIDLRACVQPIRGQLTCTRFYKP